MKKVFAIICTLFFLSGCASNEATLVESSEVAVKEMTKLNALQHLEEITYRMINAGNETNGSFEQLSEVQAGLSRIESEREEIISTYDPEEPIVADLLSIADWTEMALEEMLAEKYSDAYDTAEIVGSELSAYSRTYLDGDFPPTVATMLRIQELENQHE